MDQQQLFVKMALHNWNTQIARAEKIFNSYTEKEFYKEIAPGKNRIIYIYGHLAAYHDILKETLGIGERSYSGLAAMFLQHPDSPTVSYPSLNDLSSIWKDVHEHLKQLFNDLPVEDWFKRHSAMTDEDFEADPSRNRLSVLLNRTNHVAYHLGQVILVKPETN
jgi:hypothetical protein